MNFWLKLFCEVYFKVSGLNKICNFFFSQNNQGKRKKTFIRHSTRNTQFFITKTQLLLKCLCPYMVEKLQTSKEIFKNNVLLH